MIDDFFEDEDEEIFYADVEKAYQDLADFKKKTKDDQLAFLSLLEKLCDQPIDNRDVIRNAVLATKAAIDCGNMERSP